MFTDAKGRLHWGWDTKVTEGDPLGIKLMEKWGLQFHLTQWGAPQVRAKGTWLPGSHPLKSHYRERALDGASVDAHPPQSLFSASVK